MRSCARRLVLKTDLADPGRCGYGKYFQVNIRKVGSCFIWVLFPHFHLVGISCMGNSGTLATDAQNACLVSVHYWIGKC